MLRNQKKNTNKTGVLAIFAFVIMAGFLFFWNVQYSYAAGNCISMNVLFRQQNGGSTAKPVNSKVDCDNFCASLGLTSSECYYIDETKADTSSPNLARDAAKQGSGLAQLMNDPLGTVITAVFTGILTVLGWFLTAAITVFSWAVDSRVFDFILGTNGYIYFAWMKVRDFLNVFFILVLLYSAFCTIFQIERYSYKRVLLTLVIMALLVNFSFPIARFIIDTSNVLMFSLIRALNIGTDAGNNNIFIEVLDKTNSGKLLSFNPAGDITSLIAAIIFVAIVTITFIIMAILFVIRTIALAVIVIFSPLAFAGAILPGLGASRWWNYLFKYAFFGPIMVFMLYIASQMMMAMQQTKFVITAGAQQNAGTFGVLIGWISTYMIPIVILWIGMVTASRMGVAGANMITNKGIGVLSWAGKKFSGAGFVSDTYKAYHARREQAKEDSWSRKLGTKLASQQDRLRGKFIGGRDAALRHERDEMAREKKEAERMDAPNMSPDKLRERAAKGNKYEKAAAIQELANRGLATQKDLDAMKASFGATSQVFMQLANKVKSYDPVAAFNSMIPERKDSKGNDLNATERATRMQEFINSNQFDLKKVNTNSLRDASFMETLYDNNAITMKDVTELRKSVDKDSAITSSLSKIAGHRNAHQNRADVNIQLAYLAQTGTRSAGAASPEWVNTLYERADKDILNRLTESQANIDKGYIVDNVNPGKFKEAMMEMKNSGARDTVLKHARLFVTSTSSAKAQSNKKTAENDPQLKNI